jgi:hypothetical protein
MVSINLIPQLPSPPGLPFGNQNTVVAGPNNDPNQYKFDELSSLLPMSLKGQTGITYSFPILAFDEELSNDLGIYKYLNKKLAKIEHMGNNPRAWKINAIFTNHISPTAIRGETWQYGKLFPDVFIPVLQLLDTPGYKIMQHPIYGQVAVQIVKRSFSINPKQARDGVLLTFECLETEVETQLNTQTPSIATVGQQVNNQISTLPPDFPPPPGLSLSQFFGQMSNAVQNVLTYPSSVVQEVQDQTMVVNAFVTGTTNSTTSLTLSYVNSLIRQARELNKPARLGTIFAPYPGAQSIGGYDLIDQSSVSSFEQSFATTDVAVKATHSLLSVNNNKSKNTSTFIDKCIQATEDTKQYYISMNAVEVTPVIVSLQQMISSLQSAQATLQTSASPASTIIQTYYPTCNMSWYNLSKQLNNSLDNLFALNTIQDSNHFYVATGTPIRFYQSGN